MQTVNRLQAAAFRLQAHGLAGRWDAHSLYEAAGTAGLQNTPPGAALLSLYARLPIQEALKLERALEDEKTLLQSWSVRAAPRIFPTVDADVFTLGVLPQTEQEMRHFIRGVEPALEKTGITAGELVRLTARAVQELLDRQDLTKDALGAAAAAWMQPLLPGGAQAVWREPSWYAQGQSLGESMARFALPVTALMGLCCHARRQAGQALLARADRWLRLPTQKASAAMEAVHAGCCLPAGDLARRYLHAYGPSNTAAFAEWAGISLSQAERAWAKIGSELAEVRFEGRKNWALAGDLDALEHAEIPDGVRLLPAHDPYLELRDRETAAAERAVQRVIWRAAGSPGVMLVQGQIAGVWRSRRQGQALLFDFSPFTALAPRARQEITAEAEGIAQLRSCAIARCRWVE